MIHNGINQDGPTQIEKQFTTVTMLRKLDGKPLPFDFEKQLK
jgi:hypothetical protein